MESRLQHLLVGAFVVGPLALLTPVHAHAASPSDELKLEPLVVREPDRREVKVDDIDTENFEIGGFAGVMDVQDFGSNAVYGVRAAYHVTEDFFVEGTYGMTRLGKTSYERLSGNVQILSDSQRDLSFYDVSLGYNIFPGESFLGRRWAFRGGLYVIAGAGSTDFAGDQVFTVNAGFGYRLAATDWLALRVDVRDHMFETDLLGSNELMHNMEISGALTIFF
jgi:outer membrane beta-barrel protein